MKKKVYAILLSLAMVVTMMPAFALTAFAEETPLPEENQAVTEYYCLDVDTGAYIDTGYVPTKDTRIVMDAEVNGEEAALFGSLYNNSGE